MRRSAVVDENTRRMTAFHEGGHALVSIYAEGSDPIHKATIIQSNFFICILRINIHSRVLRRTRFGYGVSFTRGRPALKI